MAKKDIERDPAELEEDLGTGNEGRMPGGADDVRGRAEEGEEAFEEDDDDDLEDMEEDEESL